MLQDPDAVIAAVVRGIERNAAHVYPGATPKVLNVVQRLAPWLLRRGIGA
jgi:hypothetical protein